MELRPFARVVERSAACELQMNQHVSRPVKPERPQQKSERVAEGVRLTDVQPLADVPALWRIGAVVATQIMGVLALIAALYFGRTILLPVIAGIIVGITLSPVVKIGTRAGIPAAASAILVVVLAVVVIGTVVTFFAAPLPEWIGRAPEIGAAVQQKLHVFDRPVAV